MKMVFSVHLGNENRKEKHYGVCMCEGILVNAKI